jgi:tetratricopeptide (TPR) repeat protein
MAIAEYQAATQLYPKYAEAHNSLGLVYYEQRQLEMAISEFSSGDPH